MHVRWSMVRGTPVVDDETQQTVGLLQAPLFDVDIGRIIGFFVLVPSSWTVEPAFVSVLDILSWGTRIHIRSIDKLSPPDELIRLRKYLDDPRTFLGQHVRLQVSLKHLGVCRDVQFDTRHFGIEWLFPRGLFLYKQPIAASEIAEVTDEAIWILDPFRGVQEKEPEIPLDIPPSLPDIVPTVVG